MEFFDFDFVFSFQVRLIGTLQKNQQLVLGIVESIEMWE